jgi:geranylgeranyl pyrophosphate synthase
LDFVVTQDEFGKPVNADLSLGLATAPVLYASQEFPELNELIKRNFKNDGDVEIVFHVHARPEIS